MSRIFFVLLLWAFSLCGFAPDFDVAIIGSSPFSLLEALYRHHTGHRVVILEEDKKCGGAWKSLDICGVKNADLGCHQLGHDVQIQSFLEAYVGCKLISLSHPEVPYTKNDPNGFYPSKGCHELIDNLLSLIAKTEIVLLLEHKMESVSIDPLQSMARIRTKDREITAAKVVLPEHAYVQLGEIPQMHGNTQTHYVHLYILIEDFDSPRFTYQSSIISGASRMMNLSYFTGLLGSGKQLIVFQTQGAVNADTAAAFLKQLKEKNLVNQGAKLLSSEVHDYVQSRYSKRPLLQIPGHSTVIEILNTAHIQNLLQYIPKWKMALPPW